MSYTAIVLDSTSKKILLEFFQSTIPADWEKVCHHMTINLGTAECGPASDLVGQQFEIVVRTVAHDNRVIAVGVLSKCPSNNEIKHITVAVNVNGGGKAKHSNELTNWIPLNQQIVLRGVVQVVK